MAYSCVNIKREEEEGQMPRQIPEVPRTVGTPKCKRIAADKSRTRSKSMPWQKQWDAFRAAESSSPDRSPQTRIVYEEMEDDSARVDSPMPQEAQNSGVGKGLEHNGPSMQAHEVLEESVEEMGHSSFSGGSDTMNVNLGDGNAAQVDVASAIGREVLKILNTTSREKDTLARKNKKLTDKNRLLVEENISLKLLLAQHGISLDGLKGFEVPQDHDSDDISDSMSISSGSSDGAIPPEETPSEAPTPVAQVSEGPIQSPITGPSIAENPVGISSEVRIPISQSSESSAPSPGSGESGITSPGSCPESHETSSAASSPPEEAPPETVPQSKSPLVADSDGQNKANIPTTEEFDAVSHVPSTIDQVASLEEDAHNIMPPANNEPSWRQRAESVQAMNNATKNLPSSTGDSASPAKDSYKENIPLSKIESNRAGMTDSGLAISSDTANNPQPLREPLVSKEQRREEDLSPKNASRNRGSQANLNTTIYRGTAKNVLRTSGLLASSGGNDVLKENIPLVRNETTWRAQVNVALATKGDTGKKPSGTPDHPVKQEQDAYKTTKRGGDENINISSTSNKRRRTESEIIPAATSKTITKSVLTPCIRDGNISRVARTDDQTLERGPKEFDYDGPTAGQKTYQSQPSKDSLDHEKKRKVEIKVLELKDRLEDEGMSGTEISHQTDALRRRLLKKVEQESNSKAYESKSQQAHKLIQAKTIKIEDNDNITFDYVPLPRTKAVIGQLHNHRRQEPNMLAKAKHPDDPSRFLAPRELNYDEDEIRVEEDRRALDDRHSEAIAIQSDLIDKLARGDYEEELRQLVRKKGALFKCRVLYCKEDFTEERFWIKHFEEDHPEDSSDLKVKYGIPIRRALIFTQTEASQAELVSEPVAVNRVSLKSVLNEATSTHILDATQTQSSRPDTYTDGQSRRISDDGHIWNREMYRDDQFLYGYNEGLKELNYDDEGSTMVEETTKPTSNLPQSSSTLPKKPPTTVEEAPKPRVSFTLPKKPPPPSKKY